MYSKTNLIMKTKNQSQFVSNAVRLNMKHLFVIAIMFAFSNCSEDHIKKDFVSSEGTSTLSEGTGTAAASPPGDVVGKITVGYQGWFAAQGDGSPINAWWHWALNWGQPPSNSNKGLK